MFECILYRSAVRSAASAAIAFVIAGCAGDRPEPEGVGERVVSLAPSLTKQLYLLGVRDRIVGVTTYCPQPSGTHEIDTVGTIVEPSTEAIVRLKPDLVLTSTMTNKKCIEKLRTLGVPVADFPAASTFSELCDQFVGLGQRVGRQPHAAEIVNRARRQVTDMRGELPGGKIPGVFIQVGAKPLYAAGQGTFLSDLVRIAGGSNIVTKTDFCTYSREAVLVANPDCILVITMGLTGKEEEQKWKEYEGLAAASGNRIYIVDPDRVCSPTPETFVDALALVKGLLHP